VTRDRTNGRNSTVVYSLLMKIGVDQVWVSMGSNFKKTQTHTHQRSGFSVPMSNTSV